MRVFDRRAGWFVLLLACSALSSACGLIPEREVSGRVGDTAGQPIADAEVRLTPRSRFPFLEARETAHSGPDGRFTLSTFKSDPVEVSVQKEGYMFGNVEDIAAPTAAPLQVVLERWPWVAGRVVDEAGEPVAHIEVSVSFSDRGRSLGSRNTTDAEGVFKIAEIDARSWDSTGAPEPPSQEIEPGPQAPIPLVLEVKAPGYRPYHQSGIEVAPAGLLSDLEVILQRGDELVGQVLTADGKPAADAVVSAKWDGVEEFHADGDGRYRVTGLEPGMYRFTAEHPVYGRDLRKIEIQTGRNTFDMTLGGTAGFAGRVLGPESEPVGEARLTLQGEAQPELQTVSGPDGSFAFPAVPVGSYTLIVTAEKYARLRRPDTVVNAEAPTSGLVLRLATGTRLTGHVRGLKPEDLSGVHIVVYGLSKDPPGEPVDPQGRYTIPHLPPGSWSVTARLSDYSRHLHETVDITPGMTEAVLDFDFGQGFTLTGSVWQGDTPVGNASVEISGRPHGYSTATLADGTFREEGVIAGEYRLRVRAAAGTALETIVINGDRDVRIELTPFGQVSGRVRNGLDLTPIADATVLLWPSKEVREASDSSGVGSRSDSLGRFIHHHVPPGRWRLKVEKDGYAPYESESEIEVASGEKVEGVEIELAANEPVVFSVALPSGERPETVLLAVFGECCGSACGNAVVQGHYKPAADGTIRLNNVPAGEWRMMLSAAGAGATELPLTAPGNAGRIRLPSGGDLTVTVPELLSDGTAANASWDSISLVGPNGQRYRQVGTFNDDFCDDRIHRGRFVARRLAAGSWQVNVKAEDGRKWTGTAVVTPGETTELSLP